MKADKWVGGKATCCLFALARAAFRTDNVTDFDECKGERERERERKKEKERKRERREERN